METNQLIEKADSYINAIAAKLGVAADHVYPILVKQQVIEGSLRLSIFLIMLIISVISLVKMIKIGVEKEWEDGAYLILVFISAAMTIGTTIGLFAKAHHYIGQIINPEFYAIEYIVKSLK